MRQLTVFVVFALLQLSLSLVSAQSTLIWYDKPVKISPVGSSWTDGVCPFESGKSLNFIYTSGKYILGTGDTLPSGLNRVLFSADFDVLSVRPVNYTSLLNPFPNYSWAGGNRKGEAFLFLDQLNGSYSFDSVNTVTYNGAYHAATIVGYDSLGDFSGNIDFDSTILILYLGHDHMYDPVFWVHCDYPGVFDDYYVVLHKDMSGIKTKTAKFVKGDNNGNDVSINMIVPADSGRMLIAGSVQGNPDIDPTAAVFKFGSSVPASTGFIAFIDSSFHVLNAHRFQFESAVLDISYANNKIEMAGTYNGINVVNTSNGAVVMPNLNPYGLQLFFTRADSSLNFDWLYYYSDTSFLNFDNLNYFNRGYNQRGGLFYWMGGASPACQSNSPIPVAKNNEVELLHCDTSGVVRSYGRFQHPPNVNNFYPFAQHIFNDSTLFFSSQVIRQFNLSMNAAPVYFQPDATDAGSVMAAYRIRPEPVYRASGRMVADINANFIVDSTDVFLRDQQAYQPLPYSSAYSSYNGNYELRLDSGYHVVKAANHIHLNSCQPAFYQMVLNDQLPEDTGNVFYFTPEANVCDLGVKASGLGFFRQGLAYTIWVELTNNGTVASSGDLCVRFDNSKVVFDSSSFMPSAIYSDSVVFSSLQMGLLSQTALRMYFSAIPPFVLGTTAAYSFDFIPDSICDYNLIDNSDHVYSVLSASFDPNDKVADCAPLVNANTVDSSFVIPYTIHFQNTGNDTAFKVVLVDTLSPLLDVTTLGDFHASHPFELALVDGHILVATFDPIALTDTGTNYASSEGYFSFSIKPKLPAINGTAIINRAAIFFDYNLPVITEPSIVAFASPVGLSDMTATTGGGLLAFPNPAGDMVQVMCVDRSLLSSVRMMDLSGRVVMDYSGKSDYLLSLDLSGLSPGIYLIQATNSGDNLHTTRMVKR